MRAWDVQVAILARLEAYAALMAIATDVYDDVPQDAEFPYVVIGDKTTTPFDTADSTGDEQTVTIHTWSEYRGKKQTNELQGHIYDALNRHELAVSGGTLITCEQEYAEDFVDDDGLRRHGVQRFRVIVDG